MEDFYSSGRCYGVEEGHIVNGRKNGLFRLSTLNGLRYVAFLKDSKLHGKYIAGGDCVGKVYKND